MHLVKVGHGSQVLSSKYDVISLMAININTLSVADGLEANVMEPVNRGTYEERLFRESKVASERRGGDVRSARRKMIERSCWARLS